MLSKRQMTILDTLLENKHRYCRGTQLAQILNVSVKTVQTEIRALRSLIPDGDIIIRAIPNKGYMIADCTAEQLRQLDEIMRDSRAGSTAEGDPSELDIVWQLLEHDSDYIRTEDLADILYMSASKLTKDLTKVKERLNRYHLSLEKNARKGIRICGREADKRNMILSEELLSRETDMGRSAVMQVLMALVLDVLSSHRYLSSDASVENMILHLYLALGRISTGHHLDDDIEYNISTDSEEYVIAKEICTRIRDKMGKYLSYSEINYLALLIRAEEHAGRVPIYTEESDRIVEGILEKIRMMYGVSFLHDRTLRLSLSLHIKPMLIRAKNGFLLENPIYKDIVTGYPLAHEFALCAAQYICRETGLHISKHEVSYLSAYFALANEDRAESGGKCRVLIISTQRAINSMLMRKEFRKHFSDKVDELAFCNYLELKEIDLSEYDAVFTTAIDAALVPAYIPRIHYYLREDDIRIIDAVIQKQKEQKMFQDFFLRDTVLFFPRAETREQLVRKMCSAVSGRFRAADTQMLYASVISAMQNGFVYSSQGLMILHPEQRMGNKEMIVVTAFCRQDIKISGMEDLSVLMLVFPGEADGQNLSVFYQGISDVFADIDLYLSFLQTDSYPKLMQTIGRIK